jgi:hypothetical protein
MILRTQDPMYSKEPARSYFARQTESFISLATAAGAGLVVCGSILFLLTYLAGWQFSQKFVYAALFAIGGLSGFTALGFSFLAHDDNNPKQRGLVTGHGLARYAAPSRVASVFLAIAYLCIIAVAVSTGFFNR